MSGEGSPEGPGGERPSTGSGQRLQKVLAAAGVASRRVSEQLIVAGRVTVNGRVVTELGTRVDPVADEVSVDGTAVQLDPSRRYLVLNKPTGVVSSMRDERGRPDLRQFLPGDGSRPSTGSGQRPSTGSGQRPSAGSGQRLFNVGRLDAETSGLLLLTNDGPLAHVLAHPSFGVTKTYIATVRGAAAPATLRRLEKGIELEDGPIAADRVRLVGEASRGRSLVEITLHSGRNRIVRRMLAAVGHPVLELVRRQFGPLHLGTLPMGAVREVTRVELGELLTLARASQARPDTPDPARSDAR